MGLSTKLFVAMMALNLLTSAAFTLQSYSQDKKSILQGIDDKLLASAEAVRLVADPFHDRAGKSDSLSTQDYEAFIDRLSAFAQNAKLEYAYTTVQREDQILFTSSSYTQEEKESGDFSKFLDPYDDASDGLKAAFADRAAHYDQYSDQWGSFRSLFVPVHSPAGLDYVIGVDVSLAGIDAMLRATLIECLLIGAAVFATGLITLWLLTQRLVARPLHQVIAVFAKIGAGDYASRFDASRRDEIGTLLRELARMQSNLAERTAADRQGAESMRRVTSALDTASTSLMVADHGDVIIYVNLACAQMLRGLEDQLREAHPDFSADALIGCKITDLLDQALEASDLLTDLRETRTVQTALGGRTFKLTANPVLDDAGRRLGAVLEWVDRTSEVAAEVELDALLKAVARGDFSQRLSLDDKAGFLRELAAGMNGLTLTVAQVLDELASVLSGVAQGDLSRRIESDFEGRFAELKRDTNTTVEQLRHLVGSIQEAAAAILGAAREMAAGNADLSQRTEEQASSLAETTTTFTDFNEALVRNTRHAQAAMDLTHQANNGAAAGGRLVEQVIATMGTIQASSRSMSDIIGVIDSIAFQTNILALNAAVEAARAGEQGRGFAVVAAEVRGLAQRSAQAAKEIKVLIGGSVDKVDEGVRLVEAAGSTMSGIVTSFQKVLGLVTEIADLGQEQDSGMRQVSQSLVALDEMTQRNAALVEEAAAGAESLEHQADELSRTVARFRMDSAPQGSAARRLRADPAIEAPRRQSA